MSEEQKIAELKRMEAINKPYTGKHTPYTKPAPKLASWRKITRDVLAFALFALVLAALWNMMPANEVEPTYTSAQIVVASPTFLAMTTAMTLQTTPTLAPTATDTATPQATNTGTASPTATQTATSTMTKTPRPAYAIVKVVTAVPTPLPPLDPMPFYEPILYTALFLVWLFWFVFLAFVWARWNETKKAIAAAASMSKPSPSSEVPSPPTWQPVTNQINVYTSKPVTRAPLAEDTDAITVWPDVSEDFAPRGELATSPTPAEDEQGTAQNDPVSRVTPETRAALLFERAAKNGGVPLFSGDKMPEGEEWQDIHALYQNLLALEFGRGKGGAKKATYEILWGRSAAGEGSYKIYSDKMNELDKEHKNE